MRSKMIPTMRGSLSDLLSASSQKAARALSSRTATRLTSPDGLVALPTIGHDLRLALAERLLPAFKLAFLLRRLRVTGAGVSTDQLSQLTLKILLCLDMPSEPTAVSFWNLWADLTATAAPRAVSEARGSENVWASYIRHMAASGRTQEPKQVRGHLVEAFVQLPLGLHAVLRAGAEAARMDGVLVKILFRGRKSYKLVYHSQSRSPKRRIAPFVFRELRRVKRRRDGVRN